MKKYLAIPDRARFGRLFYGIALIFLFLRWKNHLFFSQLQQPVLISVGHDFTYVLFAFSGLTRFLTQNYLPALVFDICLVATAVLAFVYPRQNKPSIAFTILLAIYLVAGYSVLCFHKHNLTGLWFCSLIFLPAGEQDFYLLFRFIRYYCLFVYSSSGFWKLYRNSWNEKGQLAVILKNDALAYLVQHPVSLRSGIISWCIVHTPVLDNLMMATCLFQLAFLIGFFTRKLDWLFFFFALTFHLFSYLFLRAYFLEFSAILITLAPLPILYRPKASV